MNPRNIWYTLINFTQICQKYHKTPVLQVARFSYDEAAILTSWKIAFCDIFFPRMYISSTDPGGLPSGIFFASFLWWSCNFNVVKNSFFCDIIFPRMYISSTDPGGLPSGIFIASFLWWSCNFNVMKNSIFCDIFCSKNVHIFYRPG